MTPGDMITKLRDIKTQREALSKDFKAADKELVEEYEEIERELIKTMGDLGLDKLSNDADTVTVTENVLPQVEDWDVFYDYVIATARPYMFYKRILPTAWRELMELEGEVPGTSAYTETKISLRKR